MSKAHGGRATFLIFRMDPGHTGQLTPRQACRSICSPASPSGCSVQRLLAPWDQQYRNNMSGVAIVHWWSPKDLDGWTGAHVSDAKCGAPSGHFCPRSPVPQKANFDKLLIPWYTGGRCEACHSRLH